MILKNAWRAHIVVVGGGYTGTEVTAHGQLMTLRLVKTMPGLDGHQIRWMLLDNGTRLLQGLDQRLSETAERVLRRRGVEVLTGESVAQASDGYVKLTTGEKVQTRSLIWCVGFVPTRSSTVSRSQRKEDDWWWMSSWVCRAPMESMHVEIARLSRISPARDRSAA